MKNRWIYFVIIAIIVGAAVYVTINNSAYWSEKKIVRSVIGDSINENLDIIADKYVKEYFPGIERVYSSSDKSAIITHCLGYKGPVRVLTVIDNAKKQVLSVRILTDNETAEYAEHIKSQWFLDRFANKEALVNCVMTALEAKNAQDIIQVTGATVSSQAVVNSVNCALGVWRYMLLEVKSEKVADVIPQEMWQKDENSFVINTGEQSFRIDTDELKQYETITLDTVLHKTTGTKINTRVQGPLLSEVLKQKSIDINAFKGAGLTGRDGYYALLSEDILKNRSIILGYMYDDKPIIESEKPLRVAIPDEMGVYWVMMLSQVDLYEDIPEKDIKALHVFDALVNGIEPYYYEYYGSKDKSYEIGKILAKFINVNQKGFFTMTSTDGLVKNETIAMVRERYFIKTEGLDAPMNITPNFKLGMNVKNIALFTTTDDAVFFPSMLTQVIAGDDTDEGSIIKLADVLNAAGMKIEPSEELNIIYENDKEKLMKAEELANADIIIKDQKVRLRTADADLGEITTIKKASYLRE